MKKEALKKYLYRNCLGRDKAISGERLRKELHTSENELRKAVNQLRREGVPIASDQHGYFYARTAGEAYATIIHLEKMRAGLGAAITGMVSSLNTFGGKEAQ